jgi:hypothetical protein
MGSGLSTSRDAYRVSHDSSCSNHSPSSPTRPLSTLPSFTSLSSSAPLPITDSVHSTQKQPSPAHLTPHNIRRAKRGSFIIPKLSSQKFTSEMVGDYISQLSTWNEGYGYDGKDFMSHMKLINYRHRFIENEVDGSAILTLKTPQQQKTLLDQLEITDQKHRHIIQSAFLDLQEHLLQSIHVISYEDFISLREFPRCPDNSDMIVDLTDVDLSKSFIIFISHCWLRGYCGAPGYSGRPHPDNASNEKYQLCIESISKILSNLTDSTLQCYIWMDYSCINQDNNPAGELQHLDEIIKYSDCLLTPIVDDTIWEYIHTHQGDFYDYKASGWCFGEHSYIHRAWCRVEMFYAANVPLSKHTKTKLTSFQYGLKSALENSKRPHFLYGTREHRLSLNPIQLQPLCKEYHFFDRYHPCKGSVTVASDIEKIQQLIDELKPYLAYPLPSNLVFPSPLVTSNIIPSNLIGLNPNRTEKGRRVSPLRDRKMNSGSPSSSPSLSLRKKLTGSSLAENNRSSPLLPATSSCPSPISHAIRTSPDDIMKIEEGVLIQKTVSKVLPFLADDLDESRPSKLLNEQNLSDDDDDLLSECSSVHEYDGTESANIDSSTCFLTQPQLPGTPPKISTTNGASHSRPSPIDSPLKPLPAITRKTRDLNGCIYYGEYKDKERHGKGQLHYPNGDIFEGSFQHNTIHGNGKYTYGNGDAFVGKWKNGYRHGKGTHTVYSGDGEIIQENYRNGHKIQGKFIHSDYIFIGSYNREGKKEGQGIVRYVNGESYEGGYHNDQRCGLGRYVYLNGDIYEGSYWNDLRHGKGKYFGYNGDIFTGEFKNDKRDCEKGTLITSSGDVYNGQWKNNVKHGKFKIRYSNGDSFLGDYRQDKKHGRGVYTYSNTETYTGEYRDGKKHGQGVYRFLNGIEKKGYWKDDILIENTLSGKGNISRSISMKSILNEQHDTEEKFDECNVTTYSCDKEPSLIRGASIWMRNDRNRSTISGNSNSHSISPNRNRSSSGGSEISVTSIHRQSPLRGRKV